MEVVSKVHLDLRLFHTDKKKLYLMAFYLWCSLFLDNRYNDLQKDQRHQSSYFGKQ